KETFETCAFLLKTTMFEPLNQALTTAETLFPEHSCSDEIADMKISLARDVIRAIIDKFRARFDGETISFLQEGEDDVPLAEDDEDAVDRIVRALALAM